MYGDDTSYTMGHGCKIRHSNGGSDEIFQAKADKIRSFQSLRQEKRVQTRQEMEYLVNLQPYYSIYSQTKMVWEMKYQPIKRITPE